jgi:hypothetical protein
MYCRNFEYLCGEDPYLGARLAAPVVTGIQSQGVMANAKHWINNEIEEDRKTVSANLDERTAFEIYYPPFEAAVQAGVLSAMCAYNRVNDLYACENPVTISHLKDTLGFKGWLMSDWYLYIYIYIYTCIYMYIYLCEHMHIPLHDVPHTWLSSYYYYYHYYYNYYYQDGNALHC